MTLNVPSTFAGAALRTGTKVEGVVTTGVGTVVVGATTGASLIAGESTTPRVPPAEAGEAVPMYRSKFTEPTGSVTTFGVAFTDNAEATAAGVIVGVTPSKRAAAPATCGVAIEVPDKERDAVGDEVAAETIADPGAKISTQEP